MSALKIFVAVLMVLLCIPLSNLSWVWLKDVEQPIQALLFSSLDTNSLPFFIWGVCYLLFWRMQPQRQQDQLTVTSTLIRIYPQVISNIP